MPRHGRHLAGAGIHVDRVAATLTEESTPVRFEVPQQINALHADVLRREALAYEVSADERLLRERAIGLKD